MIRILIKNQYKVVGMLLFIVGVSISCWTWLSKKTVDPLNGKTVESRVESVSISKNKVCFFLVSNIQEYCLYDSETDIRLLESFINRKPSPNVKLEQYQFYNKVKIAYLTVNDKVIMSYEDTLLRQEQWENDSYLLSLFFCFIGLFSILFGDRINAYSKE